LNQKVRSLSPEQCDDIAKKVARLEVDIRAHQGAQSFRKYESALGEILSPLLAAEGFRTVQADIRNDTGIDFRAERGSSEAGVAAEAIGIEAKFMVRSRHVGLNQIHTLIGAGLVHGFTKVMLVSNARFSPAVHRTVEQHLPLKVELKTLEDLALWARSLSEENGDAEAEIRLLTNQLSDRLARLIARDENALRHLNWWNMEETLAYVFEGLSFNVELTPPSKDGGKDIVLRCTVAGKRAEYYVEIKHWRSATKVGASAVQKLLKVIVSEKKDGGLFLSTFGYTGTAFEQLTTFDKEILRFGDKEKVVSLCKTYVKARSGLWSVPRNLTDVLLD
jgi:restriction system protein